jgi:predicted Zn-dependent protease
MPVQPNIPHYWWLIVAALSLTGCDFSQWRARGAEADYQAAVADNNLVAARDALTRLVAIQDNVADNWVQLGKLQASMGSIDAAYYSFTRANELNRGDPSILRALTEIALRGGDFVAAQAHGKELDVVAPGDTWAKLAAGYANLTQGHFEDAAKVADTILVDSPNEANGVLLKARALLGENREEEALKLLRSQVQAQPADLGNWALMAKIYRRHSDWRNVAQAARRVIGLNPGDPETSLLLIEAALRSGDASGGREASLRLLQADSDPARISAVLDLWSSYRPTSQAIADAEQLAAKAIGARRKLIYANFLNRAGRPAVAMRIASGFAGLPITADNAEPNAVIADSLALSGQFADAKARFDAVLAFDPGNSTALRGRSELLLRTGQPKPAIEDAQKLVSVLPQSDRDRLLLARCYAANGDKQAAQRALWDGFQAILADEPIYLAIRSTKQGNEDSLRAVDDEFDLQRDAQLNQRIF